MQLQTANVAVILKTKFYTIIYKIRHELYIYSLRVSLPLTKNSGCASVSWTSSSQTGIITKKKEYNMYKLF